MEIQNQVHRHARDAAAMREDLARTHPRGVTIVADRLGVCPATPRGAGPFVGHQLRYLVGSAHGWLGGVGFAASARRLTPATPGSDGMMPPTRPPAPGGGAVPDRAAASRCRRDSAAHARAAALRTRRSHLSLAPLAPGEGLDADSWAANEFAGAALGDARLSARLVESAHHMAQSPMRAITGATHGARALVKGHYRLIDQPADSEVSVEHILAPHRERTLQRMGSEDTVLCVQDTTSLSFTRRGQTQGLGVIGSNQTGALARGLHLHTTLAVNPDGVPLGVLRAGFDAPPPPQRDETGKPTQSTKPREERKSFRWVEGLRDCAQAAQRLPQTRVVCTMDREADFLDLFIEQRAHAPHVELLVRAKVDRVLGKDATPEGDTVSRRLFDEVRSAPARGTCTVELNRLSARVKASKQTPKSRRAARRAEVTLRYQRVALPCPGAAPVELWVVHAREERPPPKAEALEWFVLTTLPVTSTVDAQRVLRWYALRWRIEDYFRILKSGCKVFSFSCCRVACRCRARSASSPSASSASWRFPASRLHPARCHGFRLRTA